MVERESLIEIVVSVGAVVAMLAAMFAIGSSYGTANSTLSLEGGWMFVWVIVGLDSKLSERFPSHTVCCHCLRHPRPVMRVRRH